MYVPHVGVEVLHRRVLSHNTSGTSAIVLKCVKVHLNQSKRQVTQSHDLTDDLSQVTVLVKENSQSELLDLLP